MNKIIFFFKGVGKSFQDNWSIILILFVTCVASVASINFCYRTGFFAERQPEQINDYMGDSLISYVVKMDVTKDNSNEIKNELGEKYAATYTLSDKIVNGDNQSVNYVHEGFADESFITNGQYESGKKVAVIPSSFNVALGATIEIDGEKYIVVGITSQQQIYVPYNSATSVIGFNMTFVNEQLTKGEISALEKILGVKYNRDFNYSGQVDSMSIMFKVLAVLMLILACFNIQKVFKLYLSKNNSRYSLYGLTGLSKARLSSTIIGESTIILSVSMIVAFIIDNFAIRPIIKILGVEYMYDFIDILTTYGVILLILVATVSLEVFKRLYRQVGDRRNSVRRG